MRFNRKYIGELIAIPEYYDPKNDDKYAPRLPATRRAFVYQVNESKDRSFVREGGGVMLGGHWYIWPRGVADWVEKQAEKTLKQFAA